MAKGCCYGVSEERVVEMERSESHWANFTNMRNTRREIGERVEKKSVLKLREREGLWWVKLDGAGTKLKEDDEQNKNLR